VRRSACTCYVIPSFSFVIRVVAVTFGSPYGCRFSRCNALLWVTETLTRIEIRSLRERNGRSKLLRAALRLNREAELGFTAFEFRDVSGRTIGGLIGGAHNSVVAS
jgi:hypothetical protein